MKNRLFQKTLLDIDKKIREGRGTEAKVSIVMHLKEVKVMFDIIKRVNSFSKQYENFLKDILNDLEKLYKLKILICQIYQRKNVFHVKEEPHL